MKKPSLVLLLCLCACCLVLMQGCTSNINDQIKWLQESYDTLIADSWEFVFYEVDSWALMKGDIFAIGVSDENDGTPVASVVFQQRN